MVLEWSLHSLNLSGPGRFPHGTVYQHDYHQPILTNQVQDHCGQGTEALFANCLSGFDVK